MSEAFDRLAADYQLTCPSVPTQYEGKVKIPAATGFSHTITFPAGPQPNDDWWRDAWPEPTVPLAEGWSWEFSVHRWPCEFGVVTEARWSPACGREPATGGPPAGISAMGGSREGP